MRWSASARLVVLWASVMLAACGRTPLEIQKDADWEPPPDLSITDMGNESSLDDMSIDGFDIDGGDGGELDADMSIADDGGDFGVDDGGDGSRPDGGDGGRLECDVDSDCDDGVFCNGQEQCRANRCVAASSPIVCNDRVECTVDHCVESSRACEFTPDSSSCELGEMCSPTDGCVPSAECRSSMDCQDGSTCNGQEQCLSGRCAPGIALVCSDAIDCTITECSERAGGCTTTPVDARCDDRIFCNGQSTCNATMGCVPVPTPLCGPPMPCFEVFCDENRRNFCATREVGLDADRDGFSSSQCPSGNDCDDSNSSIAPGFPESCNDMVDNNCNGRVDCADSACSSMPRCSMCAPSETNCTDGRDEDCDNATDCSDTQCAMDPACRMCTVEVCTDSSDNDCDGRVDCDDTDCASSMTCVTCTTEVCTDGRDNDCDGRADCSDTDCSSAPSCVMCSPEVCRDGRDNDCDGQADCDDSDCSRDPVCQVCGTVEICRDGRDNNCNGRTDCDDPQCASSPGCRACLPREICGTAIDDDCNGLADCDDPQCAMDPSCGPGCVVEACRDGRDNDCDGDLDCDDADCAGNLLCIACLPFELDCTNGFDEDCNGLIDCDDAACRSNASCGACAPRETQCADGRDDDCDSRVDCADTDCRTSPACAIRDAGVDAAPRDMAIADARVDGTVRDMAIADARVDGTVRDMSIADARADGTRPDAARDMSTCTPTGTEGNVMSCTDGRDNDCDGQTDCDDADCTPFPGGECCNGVDDTGSMIPDLFACGCNTDMDCAGMGGTLPQICWSTTIGVCGPDCRSFGFPGNPDFLCQQFDMSLRCSQATGECTF